MEGVFREAVPGGQAWPLPVLWLPVLPCDLGLALSLSLPPCGVIWHVRQPRRPTNKTTGYWPFGLQNCELNKPPFFFIKSPMSGVLL